MIAEKEVIEAFEILHDYCDEKVECRNCLFFDEESNNHNMCILKNSIPAKYNAVKKRTKRTRGFSVTWKAKPRFYVVYKVLADGTREAVNEFQDLLEARYFKREMELCFNCNYCIVGNGFMLTERG